jgi:hypothetical protein
MTKSRRFLSAIFRKDAASRKGVVRMRWRSSAPTRTTVSTTIECARADEDLIRLEPQAHHVITVEPPSTSSLNGAHSQTQTTSFSQIVNDEPLLRGRQRQHSPSLDSSSQSPSPPRKSSFGLTPAGRGTRIAPPRSHSIRGISRAKIKTVKLTVVVIAGYVACSTPFICAQLWSTWGDPSQALSKYYAIIILRTITLLIFRL